MLFNSIEFLFFFLPFTVCVFHLLRRFRHQGIIYWLGFCSLIFYAWWEPKYLILLLCSACVNYFLGRQLGNATTPVSGKLLYGLGLIFNLGLLAYYKYAAFLIDSAASLAGWNLTAPSIILPLAISFFTFQQIAYLSDVYKTREYEPSASRYLLFVTFFPQLIAGPIVHHKEMLPQFANLAEQFHQRLIAPAITLIVLGLAKKVLVADSLALFANPGFTLASQDVLMASSEAWLSITAYTLQIYFDFSGYCDIAIGCALLMGIRLPINFMSPYQSASISEYWRRWHMTLSRFMRDYVYIPLGGNRRGDTRWLLNLLATTAVSGLWHGAGWTFVIWGCLHGLMLIINHLWRRIAVKWPALKTSKLWHVLCVTLTFLCVLLAFVLFRSTDLPSAQVFYSSLVSGPLESHYWENVNSALRGDVFELLAASIGTSTLAWGLISLAILIVFFVPNSLALIGQQRWGFPALEQGIDRWWLAISWKLNAAWALAIGVLFWLVCLSLTAVSPFLYFQF